MKFLDYVAKQLNFKTPEDWYKIQAQDIRRFGGSRLLEIHGSRVKLLRTLYPNIDWKEDKFVVRRAIWTVKSHQREFLDNMAKKLNLSSYEDWYNVKTRGIIASILCLIIY
jgi:hypothetical protein